MRATLQRHLGAVARGLLGRRNAIRLGRLLMDAGRLDVPNDMATNGESLVQKTFLREAPQGEKLVVFDAGANVGLWTRSLFAHADAVGRGDLQLHLFEPSSATHARLAGNLEGWALAGRVRTVPRGLSDRQGSAELFVNHELAGSNSLHRAGHGESEKIELTTLDAYCAEQGIERVHLLKCDLEGHDLIALEGAARMLERGALELVQFEYNWRWTEPRKLLKDAFALLEPHGYTLGKITPLGVEFYPGWHPELENFRECNYLACQAPWTDRLPRVAWWHPDSRELSARR